MPDIDCVILWVDGTDPKWLACKNEYSTSLNTRQEDAEVERYRDFDILKYLFRGIEEFMPWVRNVFFVTCGQTPSWMNTNNHRLRLINHSDYIPKEYLPTFNSHTIEMNLHRIDDLAECFVYFNDDMFVLNNTTSTDFFKDGLPCDSAVLNAIAMEKGDKEFRFLMPINDIEIINKHFNKSEVLKRSWRKFYNPKYGKDMLRTLCLSPWIHFTGFYNYHLPYSLKKSVLEELWSKEPEALDNTCDHRFRNSNDLNIWLASYWQYATGQFAPRSPKIGLSTSISDDMAANELVYESIEKQKAKLIVINDNVVAADPMAISRRLVGAFESILPRKSSFEK